MIRALVHPVGLIGLLLAFALAMVVRGVVQRTLATRTGLRTPVWNLRADFDVFGIVAAIMGGTGWGRRARSGFGAPSYAILLAGPAAVLALSQLAFAGYRLIGGPPTIGDGSTVLWGVGAPFATELQEVVLALAVGLLYAGLLALVPLPPLDGWGVLDRRYGLRRSDGFEKAKLWLDEKNIGVAILLVGLVLPFVNGAPLFLFLLDLIGTPVLRLWTA